MAHRILVAVSDRNTIELLRCHLEADGYDVIIAPDGNIAWALIQMHRPTLAVLEATLPGLSGLEIVHRVRAHVQLATLPVILIGSPATEDEKIRLLASVVDDYVVKPVSIPVLVARVRALLRRVLLDQPCAWSR
jgi:two-component system phosphate regulon response regulator PhoB